MSCSSAHQVILSHTVPYKNLHWLLPISSLILGCAVGADPVDKSQEGWDSQGGNPTHATHSYLTEHALDSLAWEHPDLVTYRSDVITGANLELHELPVKDAEQEKLRVEAGGTNWGCEHPEVYWRHAKERWLAGDKAKAYWFVGILLHFVEDLGVPAHSFHVWHENTPSTWDHFELLAFQKWSPSYDAIDQWDPWYESPADYVGVSASWAADDFHGAYPGVTYTRTFFSKTWLFASSKEKTFVRNREGRTATVATWALAAAADGLEAL
jgi:hypothetical protein